MTSEYRLFKGHKFLNNICINCKLSFASVEVHGYPCKPSIHGNYANNFNDKQTFENENNREYVGDNGSNASDPYSILGIQRGASIDEVRNAYLLLAKRTHPDKIQFMDEEIQKAAKKRFLEIKKAYDDIIEEMH